MMRINSSRKLRSISPRTALRSGREASRVNGEAAALVVRGAPDPLVVIGSTGMVSTAGRTEKGMMIHTARLMFNPIVVAAVVTDSPETITVVIESKETGKIDPTEIGTMANGDPVGTETTRTTEKAGKFGNGGRVVMVNADLATTTVRMATVATTVHPVTTTTARVVVTEIGTATGKVARDALPATTIVLIGLTGMANPIAKAVLTATTAPIAVIARRDVNDPPEKTAATDQTALRDMTVPSDLTARTATLIVLLANARREASAGSITGTEKIAVAVPATKVETVLPGTTRPPLRATADPRDRAADREITAAKQWR